MTNFIVEEIRLCSLIYGSLDSFHGHNVNLAAQMGTTD